MTVPTVIYRDARDIRPGVFIRVSGEMRLLVRVRDVPVLVNTVTIPAREFMHKSPFREGGIQYAIFLRGSQVPVLVD